jgi:hypothetical protein
MFTSKIHQALVGLSMALLTSISVADVSQPNPGKQKPTQMEKDVWLEHVKKVVPMPICKGFLEDPSISNRFKEVNVTYETCLNEIPQLTDACVKGFYNKLPAQIDQTSASTWGRKIGECIGTEFAKKYLYPEDDSGSTTDAKSKPVS